MTSNTAIEEAVVAGKTSALAQIACGKPVLLIDEINLNDLDCANAHGWNSVFASPENGKLPKAAATVSPGQSCGGT